MPNPFSAATVRSTWSRRLAYVSGRASRARIATDEGLPAARSSEIVHGSAMDFLGVEGDCVPIRLGRGAPSKGLPSTDRATIVSITILTWGTALAITRPRRALTAPSRAGLCGALMRRRSRNLERGIGDARPNSRPLDRRPGRQVWSVVAAPHRRHLHVDDREPP